MERQTQVTLMQDKNSNEEARQHAQKTGQ